MNVSVDELPARPKDARAFRQPRRPGFADCAPSGRVRLDAIACWLQDVAYADVEDAGLERVAVWVVRRTRIRVHRFPRFGERFELTTYCSGLGRMWAERRTDVTRAGEAVPDVEAVSLWVHLSGDTGRPTPLTEREIRTYSGSEPARRVTARLHHPGPPEDTAEPPPAEPSTAGRPPAEPPTAEPATTPGTWTFRATECDIADHVNNAAYWQPLEEELLAADEPARLDAEIEYRTPAQPGAKRILRDGEYRWIVAADGELHASIRLVHAG